jgi:hypothetical protein
VNAHTDKLKRSRRFNVGGVLVRNESQGGGRVGDSTSVECLFSSISPLPGAHGVEPRGGGSVEHLNHLAAAVRRCIVSNQSAAG